MTVIVYEGRGVIASIIRYYFKEKIPALTCKARVANEYLNIECEMVPLYREITLTHKTPTMNSMGLVNVFDKE